jgi:hypothetical protein
MRGSGQSMPRLDNQFNFFDQAAASVSNATKYKYEGIPLLTCEHWSIAFRNFNYTTSEVTYGNLGYYFCAGEKSIDITALILIALTGY